MIIIAYIFERYCFLYTNVQTSEWKSILCNVINVVKSLKEEEQGGLREVKTSVWNMFQTLHQVTYTSNTMVCSLVYGTH